MFKNVIFDFGQVLVKFEPKYITEKYISGEDATLVEKVVFDRKYWKKLDEGSITDEELIIEFKKNLPQKLWGVAQKVYYNWIYNIPEINGMRDIIKALKQKGCKVYLLSNISTYFSSHKSEISILELFDGLVFSGEIRLVKPNKEIFEYICNKFSLEKTKTLFIDDKEENIQGAKAVGLNAYLFDGNPEKLNNYLKL